MKEEENVKNPKINQSERSTEYYTTSASNNPTSCFGVTHLLNFLSLSGLEFVLWRVRPSLGVFIVGFGMGWKAETVVSYNGTSKLQRPWFCSPASGFSVFFFFW